MVLDTIHEGDNLPLLKSFPKSSVDCVYADPPFNTGSSFQAHAGGYDDKFLASVNAPDGFEWLKSGVFDVKSVNYLCYMAYRLIEIRRVLKATGHFFLHCDYREAGNLRVLGDYIFDRARFKNEIIWRYPKSYNHDQTLVRVKYFPVSHNSILWWEGGVDAPFYPLHTPYTPKQVRDIFHHKTAEGRRYRSRADHGRVRIFADECPGIPMLDVWDINVASLAQRTGYPTEKPMALLKRIVSCSTQEGDVVLDPFCGSGASMLTARNLKRRFVGIDINKEAVLYSEIRLGLRKKKG